MLEFGPFTLPEFASHLMNQQTTHHAVCVAHKSATDVGFGSLVLFTWTALQNVIPFPVSY